MSLRILNFIIPSDFHDGFPVRIIVRMSDSRHAAGGEVNKYGTAHQGNA